jgi:UDP-N-acetylglucosamine/UDP-N-acetylgalactosamine diphosphorylase
MTCKVVRRLGADDRMGTVVREDGRLRVVEYSEVREPVRSGRDAEGALRFRAGSIGVHAYAPALVRRMAADRATALPFHAARKSVTALDPDAEAPTPRRLEAIKLERFVFDALPHARRPGLVEALRVEEYAPVKQPGGAESPARAREALTALYRSWLARAGIDAPPEGTMLEIDHARIPDPETLRGLGLRAWHEAGDAIVSGDGARG